MKNTIQPKKKVEQQQEYPNLNQKSVQKKQANINNPFLPNNPNNNTNNPFAKPNTNNGKNTAVVGQMKVAQNSVIQRATTTAPQRRRSRRPAPVAHNESYNQLNGMSLESGRGRTSITGTLEDSKEGAGDVMDNAEGMMGDFNDGLGAMGDHNDAQSMLAKTELANQQGIGVGDLSEEDSEAETGKEVTFKGQDTLGGITGTVGGLLTMGSAIKAWGDSEDSWGKAGAVLQGAGGAADVVSNVAGMLGADKISAIADSVSAGIGAVKSTLEVIKGLKELKSFEGDKKEKGMEIAKSGADALKKGFQATQKMIQGLGGLAPAAVTQAIPVLSIIFSVIDIIQEALSLVEAVKNYREMASEKDLLKQDADSSHFTKKEKKGIIGFRKEKQVTNKEQLEKVKSGNIGGNLSQDKKEEIAGKAKDYDMIRSLKKINKERIIRSATNIGLNVMNIVGDVAILTGAGAPVGVIIKASAGIIKGGLKMFRGAKQLYNNIKGNSGSSDNQHKRRIEQIRYIFSLTKSMTAFPTNTNAGRTKANAMGDKISKYVGAMGTSVEDFVKHKTDPDKAIKLLYSALKKREAGDNVGA